MRKRIFNIVGESFDNADGTSRQEELKQCYPGDPIILEREPENPHGTTAILVKTANGVGIGYIASKDSKDLAPILDSGRKHRSQIHELRGGLDGYETIGCRIAIAFDDENFRPVHALKTEQTKIQPSSSGCFGILFVCGLSPVILYLLQ